MNRDSQTPLLSNRSFKNSTRRSLFYIFTFFFTLLGLFQYLQEKNHNATESKIGGETISLMKDPYAHLNLPSLTDPPTGAKLSSQPTVTPTLKPRKDGKPHGAGVFETPDDTPPESPATGPAPSGKKLDIISPAIMSEISGEFSAPTSPQPIQSHGEAESSQMRTNPALSQERSSDTRKSSKARMEPSSSNAGSSSMHANMGYLPDTGSSMMHSMMGDTDLESRLLPSQITEPIDPLPMPGSRSDTDVAKCDDEIRGFEARVAPCAFHISQDVTFIKLTMFQKLQIPMVIDSTKSCKGYLCDVEDTHCCQKRRHCRNFPRDVPDICPQGARANPYQYAFCRTIPCTIADADICCVPIRIGPRPRTEFQNMAMPQNVRRFIWYEGLYERVEMWSKKSRVAPHDKAPYTVPSISFREGAIAWFDMNRIYQDPKSKDQWAPLVNFMAAWGDSYGWNGDAWMKIKKGNTPIFNYPRKYLQVHSSMDGKIIYSWVTLQNLERLSPPGHGEGSMRWQMFT